jgi:PhzF family phenazine biosynthesis protein
MKQRIVQVDAFTATPFTGNPAAVCILAAPADEIWMQQVATEMNLSETAFLLPESDGYRLRWFTPAVEVKLCGHATLASAHVLWEDGHLPTGAVARFHTLSGLLTATHEDDGWITLDFPSQPSMPIATPAGLTEALGAEPISVGKNGSDILVELASEREVRELRPDVTRLLAIQARGIIVTSRSESGTYDFISRFFAPAVGVPEDPVTGSAHCCLAPFWAERLRRNEMTGYQASARGGVVRVRTAGERVLISGQAVTTLRGELL